jgi:hypothetical protein
MAYSKNCGSEYKLTYDVKHDIMTKNVATFVALCEFIKVQLSDKMSNNYWTHTRETTMKNKQELLNLWDKAPIQKFLNFSALDSIQLRQDGCTITDDWARALYLFEVYSGGGYITSFLGASRIWRFAQGRFNIPYAEQIAAIFFKEQLYTFHHNRDVPTLLNRIAKIIGNSEIHIDGELHLILSVIEEKTGFKFEPCPVDDTKKEKKSALVFFHGSRQVGMSHALANLDEKEEDKKTDPINSYIGQYM